jgi:hypothetical protein
MENINIANIELIKLSLNIVMSINAIIAIIKGFYEYRKSVEQKRIELFDNYRKRLTEDKIIYDILNLLETNDESGIDKLKRLDKYLFLGFYEEIALFVNSKILRPEIAHYMFSYYSILCWKNKLFWKDIDRDSIYWNVFREFVKKMQELENSNPQSQEIKI